MTSSDGLAMDLSREAIDALSDVELQQRYDAATAHVSPGLNFWRDEIWLRRQQRAQEHALQLTREANQQATTMRRLTWANVGLTIAVAAMIAINVWTSVA